MSENEIKPVAWCAVDDSRNDWAFAWDGTGRRPWHDAPLYDQAAIDRLTAERDAAVANAERYLFLRNASIEVPSSGVEVAIWEDDCGEAIRGDALDATIDAARAQEPQA